MKNLHILPTDKPSRLVKFFTNKLHLCKEILPIQDEEQYQNIYITSDEEIKQGDWCIYKTGEIIHYLVKLNIDNLKKIILTTDPDLIKDGVQAIDDEFLEWFVKNPSCESVVVENIPNNNWGFDLEEPMNLGYKIIIPKEEPKQETLEEEFKFKNRQMGAAGFVGNKIMENMISKFKQETLEEAAERFFNKRAKEEGFENWTQIIVQQEWEFIETFPIEFAKWQAERMYSEEDLKEAFEAGHKKGFSGYPNTENWKELPFEKWFEQFKKK